MNRLAKLIISVMIFGVKWWIQLFRRALGLPVSPTAVVLYYHAVPDEQRIRFAAQMDDLIAFCEAIPADLDAGLAPGHRYAAVTFDDGLQSVVKNALPELSKRGIPCTLFIIADALGKKMNWARYRKWNGSQESVITAEQLRSLPQDAVTIGAHTLTHPKLTAIELESAKKEISESRVKLEQLLGREVRLFSFPYGDFNEQLVECCMSAGYVRAFAHLPKLAFAEPGEFLTSRVSVNPSDWRLEFRLKLCGAYSWLPFELRSRKKFSQRSGVPTTIGYGD